MSHNLQRAVLIITSHRLSTIMNADRIIVVEHGEVIEQGSHDELITTNGRYADLWSKQVFVRPRENVDIMNFIDDRPARTDDMSSERTATEHCKAGITDSGSELLDTDEEQTKKGISTPMTDHQEV